MSSTSPLSISRAVKYAFTPAALLLTRSPLVCTAV